jgi:ABC-2 type transport system permease protein
MRTILTLAMKDLRLMSRDWLGMFFIIGFPIVMAIFFGLIMGSMGGENASLTVAVVDEDRSQMSKRFVDDLAASGNVNVDKLDRGQAMDRVRRGQLTGMIAIPKVFGETVGLMWGEQPTIEVGVDPSRKAESGMLQGIIMQSIGKLMFSRFQDPTAMRPYIAEARKSIEASDDIPAVLRPGLVQVMDSLESWRQIWELSEANQTEAAGKTNDGTTKSDGEAAEFPLARIETIDVTRQLPKGSTAELVRRLRSKWDISFPQAMVWGILACAAGFAISLVRERKQGTLLRLQVAPVTRGQLVAGKALACFVSVIAVIAVMVALGFWLGMRPRSPLLLALAAVCIAACFVGIMMLMSVIGKTEEAVSGAAWGANMLMAMFGGGMVPLLFLPSFMRTLSHASPVKWTVLALEGAIWRGFTPVEMLLPCAILIATGAVCLAIGTTILSRATS